MQILPSGAAIFVRFSRDFRAILSTFFFLQFVWHFFAAWGRLCRYYLILDKASWIVSIYTKWDRLYRSYIISGGVDVEILNFQRVWAPLFSFYVAWGRLCRSDFVVTNTIYSLFFVSYMILTTFLADFVDFFGGFSGFFFCGFNCFWRILSTFWRFY